MWTHRDLEDILENITVRYMYKDEILKRYTLIAHEGYLIHNINEETSEFDTEEIDMPLSEDIFNYVAVQIEGVNE